MEWKYITPGIPDEAFIREEKIPMTKEEIRALVMSKSRLCRGYKFVDIGSGTGSVTVEAALLVGEEGKVYAIEKDEKALELTKKNVERFNLRNVIIIPGEAPEVLNKIKEKVNVVFIGGTDNLEGTIKRAKELLLPKGRIIIDAILLETVYKALSALEGDFEVEVTEAIIAKGLKTSKGYAMMARNPIFIIVAEKRD